MSLFRRTAPVTYEDLVRVRTRGSSIDTPVSSTEAMRSSVIWAGLHLRASLVSLMPVDVYRKLPDGRRVEVAPPQVLVSPDEYAEGKPIRIGQWLYASEMSLGGWGNAWGIKHSLAETGLPARIELVQAKDVWLRIKGTRVAEYRFGGETIDPKYVWHERRHLLPGVPVGMSSIMYAAMSINTGVAARRFVGDWFQHGAIPSAWFKKTDKVVSPDASAAIKAKFEETLKAGDMLVTGSDWEYTPIQAKAIESGFLDAMGASDRDLCRYVGVPGDMIDVGVDGSAITYANITQRNLQLLTINMGPDIKDHEDALSALTSKPRFVKLNRSAVLAMDPKSRAEVEKLEIDARTLTPDEARRIEDREPLSDSDYAQFDRLFGSKNAQPTKGATLA